MKKGSIILILSGLAGSVPGLTARSLKDHESDRPSIQFVMDEECRAYDLTSSPSHEGRPTGEIYVAVEQQAEFPGGMISLSNWISENIDYPEEALQNGNQGRVIVKLVIDADGSVVDATIVRGICKSLDEEALRLMKIMPKWQAAKNNGKAVASYFTLPVVFRLD